MRLFRKFGSPYWWGDAVVNGKRIRWSLEIEASDRMVLQATRKMQADCLKLASDRPSGRPRKLLKDAMQDYLDTMKASGDHRNLVTRFNKLFGYEGWEGKVYHFPDTLYVDELTTAKVTALKENRLKEGLANSSVNLEMKLLQRVYNLCRRHWLIEVDPDVRFTFLKTRFKTRWLTPNEEKAVLERLKDNQRAYDLCVFLLDTGVRLGEALELPWADVDLDRGALTIFRSKTGGHTELGMTKRVRALLEARKKDERLTQPFMHMDRPLKLLRQAIDAVCNQDPVTLKRHGKATVHSLRDTFASRLVQGDMTLYQVSKLLGHASLVMSKKYAHVAGKDNADKAVAVLDGLNPDSGPGSQGITRNDFEEPPEPDYGPNVLVFKAQSGHKS